MQCAPTEICVATQAGAPTEICVATEICAPTETGVAMSLTLCFCTP